VLGRLARTVNPKQSTVPFFSFVKFPKMAKIRKKGRNKTPTRRQMFSKIKLDFRGVNSE
jgi:hypothetical protein